MASFNCLPRLDPKLSEQGAIQMTVVVQAISCSQNLLKMKEFKMISFDFSNPMLPMLTGEQEATKIGTLVL